MTTDAPHPEVEPGDQVDDDVDDSVRPVQHDSKNPPRWLPRALAMVVVAAFVATFLSYAFGQLGGLAVNVLISFFVALALEPIVVWLVRHGWRRGAAAGVSLGGAIVVVLVVFAMFGNLFVQQLIQLVSSLPALYTSIQEGIEARWDVTSPTPTTSSRRPSTSGGRTSRQARSASAPPSWGSCSRSPRSC